MPGIQITLDDIGNPELEAWARAQGLDPTRITMQAGCLPEIWDGYIHYGRTIKDENGFDLLDQFHDRVFVVGRFKKLISPLPSGIGRVIDQPKQLSGHKCPTCESADKRVGVSA